MGSFTFRAGEWKLGAWWILATALGWALGWPISTPAAGLAVGVAQWIVLWRRRFPRAGWWVVASVIGGLLGELSGSLLIALFVNNWGMAFAYPGGMFLAMATAGAVIGTAQWLLLRKKVAKAYLWIVANSLGTALGWAAGLVVSQPWAGIFIGTFTGLLSGWVLVRFFRSALFGSREQEVPPSG